MWIVNRVSLCQQLFKEDRGEGLLSSIESSIGPSLRQPFSTPSNKDRYKILSGVNIPLWMIDNAFRRTDIVL